MYTEPVIGYRTWHAYAAQYTLRSPVVAHEVWPYDTELTARCAETVHESFRLAAPHKSPTIGCRCGIYAWHDLEDACAYHSTNAQAIVGAVLAWGKFVVAARGFRAQYMRALALSDHALCYRQPGWEALKERIIERYKIPIIPLDLLEQYAETWGKPMGTDFTE